MAAILSIDGVCKRFGAHTALDRVDLTVEQGEFIALLGPSGCGKTTLLRAIAGFLAPDAGRIAIAGQDVSRLPAHRRPLNTVFQNYALFPHLNVLDNVAYGPRRQGLSRRQAHEKARDALAMVGLPDMGARYPREMSGANSSAWRWRAPSSTNPNCCCWTSRCRRSISNCAAVCNLNSSICRRAWGLRSSSSRTIRKKP